MQHPWNEYENSSFECNETVDASKTNQIEFIFSQMCRRYTVI